MISLRPYQELAINAAIDSPLQRKLLVMCTGLGKTFTALSLAKRMGTKLLFLAHTQELVTQPAQAAKMIWPEVSHGIVRAEFNQYMRHCVFASIQSAQQPARRAKLAEQGFGLVIVDEAHHALSDGYKTVLTDLGCFKPDGPQLVGLTATPERSDGAALGEVFEGIVFQMGITSAIEQGYLVAPTIIERPINIDLDSVTVSRGDYGHKQLDVALMQAGIVDEIAKAYEEHCTNRKTIIFVVSVDQANQVASKLRERGHKVAAVSGETDKDERKRIVQKLKTGEIQAVANCMVLTEGFDEPSVDAIILGRPTQSKPLMIQKCGRGLRLYPGKTDALLIDMVGVSKRHTLIQAAVLFGAEKEERTVTRTFDPVREPELYWQERLRTQIEGVGGAPRSALRWVPGETGWLLDAGIYGAVRMRPNGNDMWWVDAVGIKTGQFRRMDLSDAPGTLEQAQAIAEDYIRRVNAINKAANDAKWRDKQASASTLKELKRSGVKAAPGITRGTAADLELQARAKQAVEPITAKQMYFMRLHGITPPAGCTRREARALIAKAYYRKRAQ